MLVFICRIFTLWIRGVTRLTKVSMIPNVSGDVHLPRRRGFKAKLLAKGINLNCSVFSLKLEKVSPWEKKDRKSHHFNSFLIIAPLVSLILLLSFSLSLLSNAPWFSILQVRSKDVNYCRVMSYDFACCFLFRFMQLKSNREDVYLSYSDMHGLSICLVGNTAS